MEPIGVLKSQDSISKKERVSNEFLFVIYFWGFTLLKPLLIMFQSKSTLILFIFAAIILIISFMKVLCTNKIILKGYYLVLGIIILILFDLLTRPNSETIRYLYEFTIYGIIPIHLFSQLKNSEKLLVIYSKLSLIAFLIFFLDPLLDYRFLVDYMSFGFNFALPAYIGLFIGRKFLNYKWMLPFEIICLAELIIFANRSSLLSIIIFWVLIEVVYEKRKTKTIILFIFFGIVMIFIQDILSIAIKLLSERGLYSYSLRHFQIYLMESDWVGMFSGRLDIWKLANEMIKEGILFGLGTGAFQARYKFYSHNLYFDLMTQYGLFGLFVFLTLILNSIIYVLRSKNYKLLLGLILLILWFPKLLLSNYFYRDIAFWCFLVLGFKK